MQIPSIRPVQKIRCLEVSIEDLEDKLPSTKLMEENFNDDQIDESHSIESDIKSYRLVIDKQNFEKLKPPKKRICFISQKISEHEDESCVSSTS